MQQGRDARDGGKPPAPVPELPKNSAFPPANAAGLAGVMDGGPNPPASPGDGGRGSKLSALGPALGPLWDCAFGYISYLLPGTEFRL